MGRVLDCFTFFITRIGYIEISTRSCGVLEYLLDCGLLMFYEE